MMKINQWFEYVYFRAIDLRTLLAARTFKFDIIGNTCKHLILRSIVAGPRELLTCMPHIRLGIFNQQSERIGLK